MSNVNILINSIKKKEVPILWDKNKYYDKKDFFKLYSFWIKEIKKKKIKPSSLIAFKSNFNISSIAFFIAALSENLILTILPLNQYGLIKEIPCKYYADIKKKKFVKSN